MSKKKKSIGELLDEAIISEEEQPYDVPSNWSWTRIEKVIKPMETRVPKNLDGEVFYYIDVDSIDNNTQTVRQVKETEISIAPSRAKRKVSKNDVIISLVRPYLKNIAHIDIQNDKLVASTAFYVCTPKEILNSNYLYGYLCSSYATQYLIDHTRGDNSPSVRSSDYEKLPFPLPPINEQKRIIEKVERLLGKIEKAKQLITEVEESFRHRRAAILDKAFQTGMLNNSDQVKTVPLNEIVEFENGDRSSAYPNTKDIVTDGVPFISTRDLNGIVIKPNDESKYISIEKFDSLRSGKLQNNDIVMSIRGSIGKIGIFKTSQKYNTGFINAQLVILRCKLKINPEFLLLYFQSNVFRNEMGSKVTGSAQPQLSVKELKTVTCPLPSLEMQQKIVNRIQSIILKMVMEQKAVEYAAKELNLIKQSILFKAFRGELGTNDSNEETSIELLKEMLQEQV